MPRVAASRPDLSTQHGRLRWARETSGFTSIRSAAEHFGWNENTYKSHEQGIRGADGLKTKTIERYAKAFKVNRGWLASGQGDPKAPDLTPDELERLRRILGTLDSTG